MIPVKETNPFEQAQICAGGVDTTEIEAETMQSKRVPGLYMVGMSMGSAADTTCSGHGHPDMQPDLMQPQGSSKDTEKLSGDRKNR